MAKARDLMHEGVECIKESENLDSAARKMRDLHVGALPICGADDRLHGIITDRDIVVHCIAEGQDPRQTTAGQLAKGTPIWIDVDADESEVLRLMEVNAIRRLPVMENHRLVGIISEADLATQVYQAEMAEFAGAVYSAPPNN